jgi:hypothetical protein
MLLFVDVLVIGVSINKQQTAFLICIEKITSIWDRNLQTTLAVLE